MNRGKRLFGLLLILGIGLGLFTGCQSRQAAAPTSAEGAGQQAAVPVGDADKKAILVVSFGTSYNDTRAATLDAIEQEIAAAYPDYELRRAYTSQTIIDKLAKRDGLEIDNVEQAMERLVADGVGTLICQPTHVMNGLEYDDMVAEVEEYAQHFAQLSIGAPLLSQTEDYLAAAQAIVEAAPELGDKDALVLMGHGTEHFANAAYAELDYVFQDYYPDKHIFVGTVEGYPMLDSVMKRVQAREIDNVYLMPLMIVAGDHAANDMAGDSEDSWKMAFKSQGYTTEPLLVGMGESPAIRAIFVQHVQAAIDQLEPKP